MFFKKKRILSMEIYEKAEVNKIVINNIGLKEENMQKCVEIIKMLTEKDIFYFGFYRTDGINLKNDEWEWCDAEIPKFFAKYGEFIQLDGVLAVGRACVNEETYKMLPWIFHYFLYTDLFCPKDITWEAYIEFQKNGFSNTSEDYFNLSDCIFNYNDSGDLFIYLNKAKYNGDQVYKKIYDLLFK